MCCLGDLKTAKEVFALLKKNGVKYIIGYKRLEVNITENGDCVVATPFRHFPIKRAGWLVAEGLDSNYKYSADMPRGIHVYFKPRRNRIPVKVMLKDIIAAEKSNAEKSNMVLNNFSDVLTKDVLTEDGLREFVAKKVFISKKSFDELLHKKINQ